MRRRESREGVQTPVPLQSVRYRLLFCTLVYVRTVRTFWLDSSFSPLTTHSLSCDSALELDARLSWRSIRESRDRDRRRRERDARARRESETETRTTTRCRNPASIEAGFLGRSSGWPGKVSLVWYGVASIAPASWGFGRCPIEAAGMSL